MFAIRTADERYLAQRDALVALTAHPALVGDDLARAFRYITELAARTLDADRVSIWRYADDRRAMRCIDAYDLAQDRHRAGEELSAADDPAYFDALARMDVVAVSDAMHGPAAAELAERHRRPAGPTSLMDAAIHLRGAIEGVVCCEHHGSRRVWTNDEITFAVAVANAVSLVLEGWERKRVESELRLHSAALNAAATAMIITDREGAIVWVNPAFTTLTGYSASEALGRNPRALFGSGVHDQRFFADFWTTILDGRVWRGEMINKRKDGSQYHEAQTITPVTDVSGAITHFIAIKHDLTAERQLEAQFRQAQKMEAIGLLAGGVAHDFNNLLTAILGYGQLLTVEVPADELRAHAGEIVSAAGRAAALTRQLLAFSRQQVMEASVVDVNALIADVGSMLRRLIGERIELTIHPAEGLDRVRADRGLLEQVLMNLVVNARDAMPSGGRLDIHTANVELEADTLSPALGVTPGAYVVIAVTDTGIGMSDELRTRIFEPFFTTKPREKGTGLGLSTVFGIVAQSGGYVSVYSEVGQGSTFKVYLPRCADGAPAASPPPQPHARGGSELVLLVEDDETVRALARVILERAGYRVFVAAKPAEAERVFDDLRAGVDLLVTDMIMPGGSGTELFQTLLSRRGTLRALFMSGYPENSALDRFGPLPRTSFLPKPFTGRQLVNAVRAVLDR